MSEAADEIILKLTTMLSHAISLSQAKDSMFEKYFKLNEETKVIIDSLKKESNHLRHENVVFLAELKNRRNEDEKQKNDNP